MSKHIGKKERWWEVGRTKFMCAFGYVEWNKRGNWDAFVTCQERPKLQRKGQPMKEQPPDRQWKKKTYHCGEFKRSQQAMRAVEERAEKLKNEKNQDRII